MAAMLSIRVEGSISGDFGKVDPRARKKAVFLSWVVINVECNRSCVCCFKWMLCLYRCLLYLFSVYLMYPRCIITLFYKSRSRCILLLSLSKPLWVLWLPSSCVSRDVTTHRRWTWAFIYMFVCVGFFK